MFEQIERPRRLVYRSTMQVPGESTVDTRMEVTFEREGDNTRLTIVQRGFAAAEVRDEHKRGWASILDALERVATARTSD